MKKELKSVRILDPELITKYEAEFAENEAKITEKVYQSVIEERARVKKIICKKSIAAPIEKVYQAYLEKAAHDLHPNLKPEELQLNGFYQTSKSNNRTIFKIKSLIENQEIMVEWFAKDQWFTRTVLFSQNKTNTKTKIKYMDISKGKRSIAGFMERHVAGVYNKRQQLAFLVQIFEMKIKLGLYPQKKIPIIEKRIARILNYSKNLF
ncbi:hypothetical protein SSABA_v1c01690 [Spiroplasma sabaudiense Ar-1343]|uniref:Uncharacterized protein n=1 Tax=Spiroplasma sabaudiense Ar-1343 TaxID=1276257 RepID=W6A9C3_9MOLU|nr:hypothetical protein [Spiroplasma sabaudiense]AHI53581.1 hypothetical protein SSABA_v1c01690 [Spiroplasma sabaudiense Ar-1343]